MWRMHDDTAPRQINSENPLAARRSEEALKQITGKQPSLLPMRRRKDRDDSI